MESTLHLLVDEGYESSRQVLEVETGQVREERVLAKEICETLGVRYKPMSEAIKSLVLYSRKGDNGDGKPVTLGDLGPFVLTRVVDGQIVNKFGVHDLCKPTRLSVDTLRQLAAIFSANGQGSAT